MWCSSMSIHLYLVTNYMLSNYYISLFIVHHTHNRLCVMVVVISGHVPDSVTQSAWIPSRIGSMILLLLFRLAGRQFDFASGYWEVES